MFASDEVKETAELAVGVTTSGFEFDFRAEGGAT
jgi:hypothetical protein